MVGRKRKREETGRKGRMSKTKGGRKVEENLEKFAFILKKNECCK